MKLHVRLFIGLVLGVVLGAALHPYAASASVSAVNANLLRPIGQIFLRSIFMIVVPMVFSALVIGVYELGQGHGLSGVAARTLGFTVIMSAASVVIGVTLVNVLQPGSGLELQTVLPAPSLVDQVRANAAAVKPLGETLAELIPRNPIESAVRALDGEMLPLMVFALIFGVALSRVHAEGEGRNILVRVLDQVFEACLIIVHAVMKLSPVAVFAIVFNTALTFGTGVFASLFLYVLTVTLGLLIQQFGVYAALLGAVARRSPWSSSGTAARSTCTPSRPPRRTRRCPSRSRSRKRSSACRPGFRGSC